MPLRILPNRPGFHLLVTFATQSEDRSLRARCFEESFLKVFFSFHRDQKRTSPDDSVLFGPPFDFHLVPVVPLLVDWRSKFRILDFRPHAGPLCVATKSKTAEAIYYRMASVTYLMERRAYSRAKCEHCKKPGMIEHEGLCGFWELHKANPTR